MTQQRPEATKTAAALASTRRTLLDMEDNICTAASFITAIRMGLESGHSAGLASADVNALLLVATMAEIAANETKAGWQTAFDMAAMR